MRWPIGLSLSLSLSPSPSLPPSSLPPSLFPLTFSKGKCISFIQASSLKSKSHPLLGRTSPPPPPPPNCMQQWCYCWLPCCLPGIDQFLAVHTRRKKKSLARTQSTQIYTSGQGVAESTTVFVLKLTLHKIRDSPGQWAVEHQISHNSLHRLHAVQELQRLDFQATTTLAPLIAPRSGAWPQVRSLTVQSSDFNCYSHRCHRHDSRNAWCLQQWL